MTLPPQLAFSAQELASSRVLHQFRKYQTTGGAEAIPNIDSEPRNWLQKGDAFFTVKMGRESWLPQQRDESIQQKALEMPILRRKGQMNWSPSNSRVLCLP